MRREVSNKLRRARVSSEIFIVGAPEIKRLPFTVSRSPFAVRRPSTFSHTLTIVLRFKFRTGHGVFDALSPRLELVGREVVRHLDGVSERQDDAAEGVGKRRLVPEIGRASCRERV